MTDEAVRSAVAEPAVEGRSDDVDQGLERLSFFSDAVIAIALTLLAIDLPLPTGDTDAKLWENFVVLLHGRYLTFLLSFVVIGAFWSSHHRLFGYISRLGPQLVRLNMLFLLAMVILPFATRLLSEDGQFRLGTILYALVVAMAGGSLLAMLAYVQRTGLLRPDTPPSMVRNMAIGSLIPMSAFLLSIPVAFFSTTWAKHAWWILSLAGSLSVRLVRAWSRRRRTA